MSASTIDIVMPIAEGRCVPQEVVEAIAAQDVPFRLWASTRVSNGQFADARNNVKRYGQTAYVLMLDNDIAMPPGSLRAMIAFLDGRADYGAIGLCKHDIVDFDSDEQWLAARHVDMSCVLFRKTVLDRIEFVDYRNAVRMGQVERMRCECANCCEDIRKMGLCIGFLPNVRAQHLHRAAHG